MTNEATLFYELEPAIPMTCSNTTGIEKGTFLKLDDPMTVSISAANEDVVGGIAKEEKIASDGKTSIGVYRHGVFKVTASGSVAVGDLLGLAGRDGDLNKVYSITGTQTIAASGSRIVGSSFETATDGETFLMELNIQGALQVA
jgi:hypothetical protein